MRSFKLILILLLASEALKPLAEPSVDLASIFSGVECVSPELRIDSDDTGDGVLAEAIGICGGSNGLGSPSAGGGRFHAPGFARGMGGGVFTAGLLKAAIRSRRDMLLGSLAGDGLEVETSALFLVGESSVEGRTILEFFCDSSNSTGDFRIDSDVECSECAEVDSCVALDIG